MCSLPLLLIAFPMNGLGIAAGLVGDARRAYGQGSSPIPAGAANVAHDRDVVLTRGPDLTEVTASTRPLHAEQIVAKGAQVDVARAAFSYPARNGVACLTVPELAEWA